MTEVEEDQCVCLACLARHFPGRILILACQHKNMKYMQVEHPLPILLFSRGSLALDSICILPSAGASTSGPLRLASDVRAGLLDKEEAASEKMCYKNLFQVWLQQRLCAGASSDARIVQLTR